MNAEWTIYVLIFGAVFLGAQGIWALASAQIQARKAATRFATLDGFSQNRSEVELLKKRGMLASQTGLAGKLHRLIVQSGTNITLMHFCFLYLVLSLLIYWLASRWGTAAGVAIGGLTSGVMLVGFFRWKRARRIAKFGEQLPDVIEIIVRSLKAGHPLPVSLSLVGREMPGPAGPEFSVVFDEISYGREIRDALETLYTRVGHPDLKFLITSIAIAHQTGGNLGEILLRLSKLIRGRFRMKRKIRALSAEGRAGGLVLSLVPLAVVGIVHILHPSYYAKFWDHPSQQAMLVLGVVLIGIGNIIIYKLVNFKV